MNLEILFGPIASGKSTYAQGRGKEGALIANDDSIVMAVHGSYMYQSELKGLYKQIRSQIIHSAALLGKDVIVDSTGLRRSTRDFLKNLAKSLDMEPIIVMFRDGRFEGASDGVRRFKADARGLSKEEWIKIGKHHATIVEPITEDLEIRKVQWNVS